MFHANLPKKISFVLLFSVLNLFKGHRPHSKQFLYCNSQLLSRLLIPSKPQLGLDQFQL